MIGFWPHRVNESLPKASFCHKQWQKYLRNAILSSLIASTRPYKKKIMKKPRFCSVGKMEFYTLIDKANHGHSTRGARSNFFVGRSDGRSIKTIAPKIWNPLSQELKALPSIASFKERSKLDLLAPCVAFACSACNCRPCGFPG